MQKNTDLSFEHIPPKVAFNKYTKFRSVPFLEYAQNAHKTDYQPNAKLQQGGSESIVSAENATAS